MRVNVYAEELPDDLDTAIEIHSKTIGGQVFTGLRIYLQLPVSALVSGSGGVHTGKQMMDATKDWTDKEFAEGVEQLKGPFMHHPDDDDSSAITIWGKKDLRSILVAAIKKLDEHHARKR